MSTDKKTIYCHYFQQHLNPLEKPPISGDIGLLIAKKISKKAWETWLVEQIKFINENKLSLNKINDRSLLKEKMMDFLKIS